MRRMASTAYYIPVEDTTVDIIDLTIRYGKAPDGSDGVTATNGEKGGGIYVYKSTVFIWGSKITYNNAGHGEPVAQEPVKVVVMGVEFIVRVAS